MDGDACYTAGLLHDVGQLALLRAYPDKYHRILARKTAGLDMLQFEKAEFDNRPLRGGSMDP